MDAELMRLTLPLPPNIANSRLHWRTKKRAKDAYYRDCDGRQLVAHVPAPPAQPLERARANITLYVHQTMDVDNAWARLKWALDWLVTRGYLADDSPAHVEYGPLLQVVDRKNKRLVVELVALDARRAG